MMAATIVPPLVLLEDPDPSGAAVDVAVDVAEAVPVLLAVGLLVADVDCDGGCATVAGEVLLRQVASSEMPTV